MPFLLVPDAEIVPALLMPPVKVGPVILIAVVAAVILLALFKLMPPTSVPLLLIWPLSVPLLKEIPDALIVPELSMLPLTVSLSTQ
ncbi:MAG: hypothetical protein WBD80_00460 [Xanthobacteraceae bacterium]